MNVLKMALGAAGALIALVPAAGRAQIERLSQDRQEKEVAALPLAQGGQAKAAIVLDAPAPQRQIAYAAQELTNWLFKVSGAALPVADTPVAGLTPVRLGTPAHSPAVAAFAAKRKDAFARIGDTDGFVIAEEDGEIFIAANKTKGVLNGVYRFLERNTDIIWVRELESEDGFGTVYGRHPDIANAVTDLVDVPRLTGHRFWTNHSSGQMRWQARLLNTFTRPMDGNLTVAKYRDVSLYGDASRLTCNLSFGIVRNRYATDSDIFPLVKGRRVDYNDCQLCFMNPKTLRLFCEEAEKIVRSMPKTVKTYDMAPGDNWDLCQCPLCTAPIRLPDGREVPPDAPNFRSTQFALFVNAVSDFLTARFPHVRPIAPQCYLFAAAAPAVPIRGGAGQYCPYIKNHKRPVFDDAVNGQWHARAEAFKNAGMPFSSLYEYYLCSTTPQFYHAVCEVARQDINYYLPGLKAMYLDTCYCDGQAWGGRGETVYDVSAIEFWVMSRLMWDPDTDVAGARREFCRRAYREAAPVMEEYYERMARNYNDDPAGCFWNDKPVAAAKHYVVEKGLAGYVRETLARAEKAAAHPASKELVRRHRARMEEYIARAEKEPPKVSLAVPQAEGPPPSADPDSPWWRAAAAVAPLTAVSKSDVPSDGRTSVRVRHDRENLFFLFDVENPEFLGLRAKWEASGGPAPEGEFDWCRCGELYLDGDLAPAGSYYHLAFEWVTGRRYTGAGPLPLAGAGPWGVEIATAGGRLRALATVPLATIGVNSTQGNRIGAMFVTNGSSWNGGQWHSPTAFQELVLEMQ